MLRFLQVATLMVLSLAALGCPWKGTAQAPNVVLISIETLRADHLSAHGYSRLTSPYIDRLASMGTLFTKAYSASSWTVPSHMTMLTSLPSLLHGMDGVGKTLDSARVTLAERFRDSGYQTAGFVSGPTLHSAFGFSQGFDLYENLSGIPEADYQGRPNNTSQAWETAHGIVTGPRVRNAVGEWLKTKAESPFFLFVHLWDPHFDYIPDYPYDTMFDPDYKGRFDFSRLSRNKRINSRMPAAEKHHLVALYDGEIAATDAVVGQLVQALEREGFDDNTLIVITSDHGDEFFEHGNKGHSKTLYEEMIHVPLIFHFPGRVKAGQRIEQAIFGSVHLMPTILALVGIDPGSEAVGRDLSSVLLGERPPRGLYAFSRLALLRRFPLYAVRTQDRKYILRQTRANPPDFDIVFYNLDEDPGEKRPISALDEEARRVAAHFRKLIDDYSSAAKALPIEGSQEAPLDERTQENLRSLGYIR